MSKEQTIYQKLITELDTMTMELRILRCDIEHLHEFSEKQHNEKQRYEKGFNLLMEHWKSLPDDDNLVELDQELQELSL